MAVAIHKLDVNDEESPMYTISSVGNVLNDIVAKVIREELEEPLDWCRLYSLSWLYALVRSMYLREDELYSNLKNIVLALLGDEKRFKIAIYDHEGAAGILFSLYHIADREKDSDQIFSKVLEFLEFIEKLRWHDFDGEIMAFSYMLASKIGAKEHINNLIRHINNSLNNWFKHLDYESQRNITYILFGFAYVLDEKLVDIIKEFKLYSISSNPLQRIMNAYDVELIALILYVFGRLTYSRKLRKRVREKIGKNAIKIIRYKVIPFIGNVLTRRISEAGILLDTKSLPPDLLAKIQLARIESGLEKPFMLSKFEWKVYQETLKALKRGYYRVHKRHLLICLLLDSTILLPLIIVSSAFLLPSPIATAIATTVSKYLPYDFAKWLSIVALNALLGINASLLYHGSIRKEYILGILKYFFIDVLIYVKRKMVSKY